MAEVSEAELLAAFGAGQVLECADAGTRRPVEAALLRISGGIDLSCPGVHV